MNKIERTEYNKEYYEQNREKIAEYQKEYYEQNKEKIAEYQKEYRLSHGGGGSVTNKSCAAYLGVTVAEKVLSHIFNNVERMSYGNPGFDFICSRNHKIDVKSACLTHREKQADSWEFRINKNRTADHFLCLAFDNRKSLNPLHIWLIPGKDVDDKISIRISVTTLQKWEKYEQTHKLGELKVCCDVLRGDI